MNDLEIARSVTPGNIFDIAQALGIHSDDLIPFGRYKAKVALSVEERLQGSVVERCVAAKFSAAKEAGWRTNHVDPSVWRDRRTRVGETLSLLQKPEKF